MSSNSNTHDFILLIFNCKKYRHKALKQKETWLNNFDLMPYFHVIGDPEIENEYRFDYLENALYVKVSDDYNSLPKKVIAAYNAIHQEYVFKYIFKTDDDQKLENITFLNTIAPSLSIKYFDVSVSIHVLSSSKVINRNQVIELILCLLIQILRTYHDNLQIPIKLFL